MTIKDALELINAIADEGSETYKEQYDNGNVAKAIEIVDDLINFLSKTLDK